MQRKRCAASERRLSLFPFIWVILGLPEVLLALRFGLKLMGANPGGGLTGFIYGLTGLFIAPFARLISTRIAGETGLEVATLLAMAVYAQLFWAIATITLILTHRFYARTGTRTMRTDA
jgi:hypothetical protein